MTLFLGVANSYGAINSPMLTWVTLTAAIGILSECRRLKVLVPEQLAIAGFGDFPFSQAFAPALTSVRLPRYAIGKAAGQQILKRLAGEAATDRVIDLGFQIMLRAST